MREEFLEPFPSIEMNATLLFGKIPVPCCIVAVTEEGYCVGIPGIEQYEGDPRLHLVTDEGVLPVRLDLQEPYRDGYYFWLVRSEHVLQATDDNLKNRCRVAMSQYGLPVTVALTLAVCLGTPSSNDGGSSLSVASIDARSLTSWISFIGQSADAKPLHKVDDLVASKSIPHVESKGPNSGARNSSPLISTVSISNSSSPFKSEGTMDVSFSGSGSTDDHNGPLGAVQSNLSNPVTLKKLLEAGQVGRIQPLTKSLVPWLFDVNGGSSAMALRMSDAACSDLKNFEASLRNQPRKTCAKAIGSLRDALVRIGTDPASVKRVPNMSQVFVIASNDANIYFQVVRGRLELVRVLPVELSKVD